MKHRVLLLCIALVCAMAVATAACYARLPALVPMHWDMQGQVNGMGPRNFLFGHVALMAAVVLLWALLPAWSPRRFAIEPFAATYWRIGLLVVGLLAFIHAMLLWGALSGSLPMARILAGGVAVFMGLLGNVMGKVRRNFWIGIRTPWTLVSEQVWYATHRLAGKTMVGSALLALAGVVGGLPVAWCTGLVLAGVLLPALYSLLLYKRYERNGKLAD